MKVGIFTKTVLFSIWNIVFIQADKETTADYWNTEAGRTLEGILNLKLNNNIARNVIVFIGDGMGISTITAARIHKGQTAGQTGEEAKLSFETFPHTALVKTYNVDKQVPDSAGTATAIFTGVKTNMAMLGVTAKVKLNDCNSSIGQEVTSILQWSQKEGKSTGIVTTTRVTDATPAALYCHSASRKWESDDLMPPDSEKCIDIASQLIEKEPGKNINVILGGGRQHFLKANSIDSHGHKGQRLDKKDLVENWLKQKKELKADAQYVTNAEELQNVNLKTTDYLLGLFASNNMEYEVDRNKSQPSITDMTKVAIKLLQRNKKGYFLMVEGARIDHGHHENRAAKALGDALALDQAIKTTLEMVNLSDTLVVVTADHSHVMTINGYPKRGTPILGIAGMSDVDKLPYTTLMYTNGPSARNDTFRQRQQLTEEKTKDKNYSQISLVPDEYETHGGEDIAIFATGPMAHLFQGVIEQNYIAHALGYAACVGTNKEHCTSSSTAVSSIFLLAVILPIFIYTMNGDN